MKSLLLEATASNGAQFSHAQIQGYYRSESYRDFDTESCIGLAEGGAASVSFILGFDMARVLGGKISGIRLK